MSRYTASILLACALLGILLWIVLSTVAQLADPQPVSPPQPSAAAAEFDAALPVIMSGDELTAWLQQLQLDGPRLITDFQNWRKARGYPDNEGWPFTDTTADSDTGPQLTEDNSTLITLAGNGDIEAAAILAGRSMRSNPAEALDWWDQAVINGSLYAMLRMSDLLQSLGDPALAKFRSDDVWRQALQEINQQSPTPNERALAWAVAAVIVGGYPVLDDEHATRITALTAKLDAAQIEQACETAQNYVLETATARRARGGAVFSTERPLFATGIADSSSVLPCDVPIVPLVSVDDCVTETFVGPGPRLWRAWFCPSP